jgi:hypothetical protein
VGQLPAAVIGLVEQLENATGVDLFKSLRPEPVGHPVRAVGGPWPADAASDGGGLPG